MSIDSSLENEAELIIGRMIQVNREYNKVGIIETVKHEIDEDGIMTTTAYGHELTGIFKNFIVIPPTGEARWIKQGMSRGVMKSFVEEQIGSLGENPKRIISLLDISSSTDRGTYWRISARYSNMADELEAASIMTAASPQIWIVNNRLLFEVAYGTNRQSNQNSSPRAIFGISHDTVRTAGIYNSVADFKNWALVAGQGVGEERDVVDVHAIPEPEGLDRRELYVDARDLADIADLPGRGYVKLSDYGSENYIEAEVLSSSGLTYQTDYDLGDLVTLEMAGQTQHTTITEATETWDEEGYSLSFVFGRPLPTIIEADKRVEIQTSEIYMAMEVAR